MEGSLEIPNHISFEDHSTYGLGEALERNKSQLLELISLSCPSHAKIHCQKDQSLKDLTKFSNVKFFVLKAQSAIRRFSKLMRGSLVWSKVDHAGPNATRSMKRARSQVTSGTLARTTSTQAHLSDREIKRSLRIELDRRVDNILKTATVGRAVLDTNVIFRSGRPMFWKIVERWESCAAAQVFSNHFPASSYFKRFAINSTNTRCSHEATMDHQACRDHLVFQCKEYENVRRLLCQLVGGDIESLSWKRILQFPNVFAAFSRQILSNEVSESSPL